MKPEEKAERYRQWKASKETAEPLMKPVAEEDKPPLPEEPEMSDAEAVQRQRNREQYPDIAAFYDDCRRYFGADVAIIDLKEVKPPANP